MKFLKIFFFSAAILSVGSCDVLEEVQSSLEQGALSNDEVARGLKQALEIGISKGSEALSQRNGYLESPYKILLPEQARELTERLSVVPGFNQVEEEIVERLNRAAEDAATKAKPIFVDAIREINFQDAMGILLGEDNAATQYLNNKTEQKLYNEFHPIILESLNKFNALGYWEKAVTTYNRIPLVQKMNPQLDDYVAREALEGLFDMVAKEEKEIRTDVSKRTTELLRRVFARQDS